jgi:hypothetical protein
MGQELKVTEIGKGQYTRPEIQGWIVVRDGGMFERIWRSAHSSLTETPLLPEIDFAEDVVIALFMGPCDSGGHEVAVMKAWKSDFRVTLNIKESFPSTNQTVTPGLAHPWGLYLVSGVGQSRISFYQVKNGSGSKAYRSRSANFVGKCRLCGKRVLEGRIGQYPGWYCEDRENCGFHCYKTMLGKRIRKASFQLLLREGQTGKLTGFVKDYDPKGSNRGKPTFNAKLVIDSAKKRPMVVSVN